MSIADALPFEDSMAERVFQEIGLEQQVAQDTLNEAKELTNGLLKVMERENDRFEYPALKAFLSHMVSCVVRAHKRESLQEMGPQIESEVGKGLVEDVFLAMSPWYKSIGVGLSRSEAILVATHIAAARVRRASNGQTD